MHPISIERVGPRLYLGGDTFAHRDRLKQAGCHWDGERKQWWIGTAKLDQIERLAAELNSVPAAPSVGLDPATPREIVADRLEELGRTEEAEAHRAPRPEAPAEDLDDARVYARVHYKDREYYQIAETRDGARVRLASLDGRIAFWVCRGAVRVLKEYPAREVWDGRRYSGRTRTEYQTVGGLRRFAERQRDPATRRGCCTECGTYGPYGQSCRECGGEGTYL